MDLLYVGTFFSDATPGARGYCEELADRLETRGYHVIRTSRHRGRVARLADILRTAWTRRAGYDVAIVSVFSNLAFVWAEAVSFELRRLGKPYILSLHGGALPQFASKWPRRTRRLLQSATQVVAPSGYLAEHLGAYCDDIEIIPNAIELRTEKVVPRTMVKPNLVWLRAFHTIYNPKLAVDVVAELARTRPDISLAMIGPDRGDGSLAATRAYAAERGQADRIRFVPGIPHVDVPHVLDAADIFLNTTDIDNTPVSILEAASAGLCIVSTNVGGVPYLLEHGKHALLVPPRDTAAMVAAVQRILDDRGLAACLSSAAHERVNEFGWSMILERWERRLEQVSHG
jgi:glycosyltransferase involved in cell wall biosynthesis